MFNKINYLIVDNKNVEVGRLNGCVCCGVSGLFFKLNKNYNRVNNYCIDINDMVNKGVECGLWEVNKKMLMVKGDNNKWTEFLDDVMFEYKDII